MSTKEASSIIIPIAAHFGIFAIKVAIVKSMMKGTGVNIKVTQQPK